MKPRMRDLLPAFNLSMSVAIYSRNSSHIIIIGGQAERFGYIFIINIFLKSEIDHLYIFKIVCY